MPLLITKHDHKERLYKSTAKGMANENRCCSLFLEANRQADFAATILYTRSSPNQR